MTTAQQTQFTSFWGLRALSALVLALLCIAAAPQIAHAQKVVKIAAGAYHTLELREDGTVWAWGRNESGQLGDGSNVDRSSPVQVPGLTGVVEIAGGGFHSLARKQDDTVWAWGRNDVGQLGDGSNVDRSSPVQVPGLTGVVEIAGGASIPSPASRTARCGRGGATTSDNSVMAASCRSAHRQSSCPA